MFQVRFTPEARAEIARVAEQEHFARPGVLIQRPAPSGNVTRAPDGRAAWEIERPFAFRVWVRDLDDTSPEIFNAQGIPVRLAFRPAAGELGVQVVVRDGALRGVPLAA